MQKNRHDKKPFDKKVCGAFGDVLNCGYVDYAILRSLFMLLMYSGLFMA